MLDHLSTHKLVTPVMHDIGKELQDYRSQIGHREEYRSAAASFIDRIDSKDEKSQKSGPGTFSDCE